MTKRIFDCFAFFNELDLLELRLHELAGKVDYFVLAEAPVTFQGQPKELVFDANKERFAAFADKIIHLVIDDMPNTKNPWEREHFQRNSLRRGLIGAIPEDIIIISDADEILRPGTIDTLLESTGFSQLNMPMYQYYMNLREQHGWNKVFAFSYHLLDRIPDFNWVRTSQEEAYQVFAGVNQKLFDAGWHFTYLGGPEKIRQKIGAFSHTESWFKTMLSPSGIETQITAGYEVGNSWNFVRYCEIDESFPAYVRQNQQKYLQLGYIKNPYDALHEMQLLIRHAHEAIRHEHRRFALLNEKYLTILARFGIQADKTHKT